MKNTVAKIPVLGSIARSVYRKWIRPLPPFEGSSEYWEKRYRTGGNSGDGSYGHLAHHKAQVLNDFVRENRIDFVIEYGCGDGHQLKLANYPAYLGFDVSPRAIAACREIYANDSSKRFKLVDEYDGETARLTLSLDVIYHLVEDSVFDAYMTRLFDSAKEFVIIYSSNADAPGIASAPHVRHRKFSPWVDEQKPEWRLHTEVPNKYPFTGDTKSSSFANFYIYERIR